MSHRSGDSSWLSSLTSHQGLLPGQGSVWLSEMRSLSPASHNLKHLLTQAVVGATALSAVGAFGKCFRKKNGEVVCVLITFHFLCLSGVYEVVNGWVCFTHSGTY